MLVKIKEVASELKNQNSIDFNRLIHVVWKLKIYFLTVVVLSIMIGFISFLLQNKEYASKSKLLLESSNRAGDLGQLGNLASMAGVNLSGTGGGGVQIDPALYEEVILSHSFIFELIHLEFFSSLYEKEVSLEEFFVLDRFDGDLPESFKKSSPLDDSLNVSDFSKVIDNEDELMEYNSFQNYAINQLKSRLTVLVEDQLLTFTVKMPEPEIATRLNSIVLNKLKNFLTAYKTEKLSRNVEFVEERKAEAEKKYREAQRNLAQFRDRNQGVISQMAKTTEENLQAELSLAFSIYTSLSQNLEQSQIQLKRETPVFFYLEKPLVSRTPSEPKLILYIFIYFGLGIVVSGMFLFGFIIYVYLNKLDLAYGK